MTQAAPTREDRLAAKLRENLRRRKEQSREIKVGPGGGPDAPDLPKTPPSR